MEKILVINDIPSYGKVASSAITPILSSMGYDISVLPTALVSNVLDFGKFEILDLTEYMKKTIEIWSDLSFKFDCIYTGFINCDEQFKIIHDYIENSKCEDKFIVVDPVMGDNGSIYPGLSKNIVENMRTLIEKADLITPNITEAALILGEDTDKLMLKEEEIKDWILRLKNMGSKSVIITSAKIKEDDSYYIYGFSNKLNDFFKVKYDYIDVSFPGTGDVFASKLIGELLKGKGIKESCQISSEFVRKTIEKSLKYNYRFEEGMKIEKCIVDNI